MITNTITNKKVITVTTAQSEPRGVPCRKTLVEYNEILSNCE